MEVHPDPSLRVVDVHVGTGDVTSPRAFVDLQHAGWVDLPRPAQVVGVREADELPLVMAKYR
jgi:hypothetical protein